MTWAAEQAAAFAQLADEFECTADWIPSTGGVPCSHPVLFDAPSKGLHFDSPGDRGMNVEMDYTAFVLTAVAADYPGLKAAVDANLAEAVSVREGEQLIGTFWVRKVRYIGDGKLIEAHLSEKGEHGVQQNRGGIDPAIAAFFTS